MSTKLKNTGLLKNCLDELRLPAIKNSFQETAQRATKEDYSFEQYLLELAELECEARRANRIERFMRESHLPLEKTPDNLDLKRYPLKISRQFKTLLEGLFLDRRENILVFGTPGAGKTHIVCAIAQEQIKRGRRVFFSTCSLLVQDLLVAKSELKLGKFIKKLSKFEAIIIDDIGYVQQTREEMVVLFTLLAERYERGSVMLTSNLAFSGWDKIFKDPMTTAAAIDRLVHHSVILDLSKVDSFRGEVAKKRKRKE